MKAITIWQPWATLIAIRAKCFETRSWATKYRGPIAIHAAKKIDFDACKEEFIRSVLQEHGYTVDNLPIGSIVATSTLKECIKSVDTWTDGYVLENGVYVSTPEYELGDFTPGRYAWEITNVKELSQPIPVKGQQGLWNWEGVL